MKSKKIFAIAVLLFALVTTGCNEEEVVAVRQDTSIPRLTSNDPLGNMKGVPRNTSITIQFNEPMAPATISNSTFFLKRDSYVVPGEVIYAGKTVTFTPTNVLDANTVYNVTITTSVTDLANNPISHDLLWQFTTGGTTTTLQRVDLGQSGDYVILAMSAINNASTSTITGDLGLSPAATSYVTGLSVTDGTGYATSAQVTGRIYAADMAIPTPVNLTAAIDNMITAYDDAANRLSPDFKDLATGNIGGRTLAPGLYKWTGSVTIPTNINISGGTNDIWIFQVAGDLSVSPAVIVTLSGGAQAKNIFWQVEGQATIGTTAHIAGNILSMTGITLQTGASINGRALAQTVVTLDSNDVSNQ
jgi:hypothetical protein